MKTIKWQPRDFKRKEIAGMKVHSKTFIEEANSYLDDFKTELAYHKKNEPSGKVKR
jgi:hypothetical protein